MNRNNHTSSKYARATFQAAASNSKKGPKHQIGLSHITCIIEKKKNIERNPGRQSGKLIPVWKQHNEYPIFQKATPFILCLHLLIMVGLAEENGKRLRNSHLLGFTHLYFVVERINAQPAYCFSMAALWNGFQPVSRLLQMSNSFWQFVKLSQRFHARVWANL